MQGLLEQAHIALRKKLRKAIRNGSPKKGVLANVSAFSKDLLFLKILWGQ